MKPSGAFTETNPSAIYSIEPSNHLLEGSVSWSASPLAKSIDRPPKRTQWIGKLLERQYWPWMAGLTALLFSLVACPNGFQLDDFYHQAIMCG